MPSRNNGTWQRLHIKRGNQFVLFFSLLRLDHNFSKPPKKGACLWLNDNLNSSKPQWLCRAVNQGPALLILNSIQTLDVHLKCTRIQDKLLH